MAVHDFNCWQFNFIYLSYDSESEMLSIRTYAGTILVVKNSEVTTIFPYKVMKLCIVWRYVYQWMLSSVWLLALFPVLPHSLGMGLVTNVKQNQQSKKLWVREIPLRTVLQPHLAETGHVFCPSYGPECCVVVSVQWTQPVTHYKWQITTGCVLDMFSVLPMVLNVVW